MPIEITSQVQLKGVMNHIVIQVINKVSDDILEIFKTQYIDKYVYGWGTPTVYKRTKEFKNAWDWSAIKVSANEISRLMFFDPAKLKSEPLKYLPVNGMRVGQYGSNYGGKWQDDAREFMPEILNNNSSKLEIPGGQRYLVPARAGSYWDEFIKDYITSGKLKQLLDKTFLVYGVKSI